MNMTRHSRSRSRGKRTSSTASSARSTLLRPNVITAGAKSSATVWKTAAKFFAAPTARGKVAKTGCGIACKPCWSLHGERAAGLVGFCKAYSRSHDAVIRVYDAAGNVVETHEHKGEFKEP